MVEIKPCTVDDVMRSGLLDAYADECAMDGLPRPSADRKAYEYMHGFGDMWLTGAWNEDNTLVGFITVLTIKAPHYGKNIAVTESFFAHPDYREYGAGTKLLRAAEHYAQQSGAIGLMVSAPAGGKLSRVMKNTAGYKLSNEVFIRGFCE